MPLEESDDSIKAGLRLKLLRHMANLTGKQLAEKCHISVATIKAWESNSPRNLTIKGANKVIEAIEKEGITCSFEWLVYGRGTKPYFSSERGNIELFSQEFTSYLAYREKQAESFLKEFKDAVLLTIDDDSMSPNLLPNDLVAGTWQAVKDLSKISNQPYLFSKGDAGILCRRLIQLQPNELKFKCIADNIKSTSKYLIIEEIELAQIAPIVVIWKHTKNM